MGHLRKRGENWQICCHTRAGRYHETVGPDKQAALARMHEIEAERCRGQEQPRIGKLTLGQHLDAWLVHEKTQVSHRSYDGYESIVRVHLRPSLGSLSLAKLQPQALQSYYARACSGGLSPRTVAKHHRLLYSALKYAVRQRLIVRNMAELVDPPRWRPKEMRSLSSEEVGRLLDACDAVTYPLVYVAVCSGLRQGEVLALRWRDIDLDQGTISVARTLHHRRGVIEFTEPKTGRSRRRVSATRSLVAYLTGYRQDRKILGMPTKADDLAFCHRDGRPISPSTLAHAFTAAARRAGLENVRYHDLRHTFASIAFSRGAAPKLIQEALGHSSVAFTMDTYSHLIPGANDSVADLLDGVLPVGRTMDVRDERQHDGPAEGRTRTDTIE